MAKFEASPTEYRGVVYRSKSEAMFARYLELEGEREGDPFGIIYEPEYFTTGDGWTPDFLRWRVIHLDNKPGVLNTLYEYKPSRPTATYINKFVERTREIQNRFSNDGHCDLLFLLFFGSVYNEDRGYAFGGTQIADFTGLRSIDWMEGYEGAIRTTRFDLEAPNGS